MLRSYSALDAPADMQVDDSTKQTEIRFEYSAFRNKQQSKALPFIITGEQFADCFTKHDCRKLKDGKMFSPSVFDGSRSNANFISASGICLDFDHGQPAVEDVLRLFPETFLAFYSTHSNTEYALKFRIVLPLSRAVNAEEHALLVASIKSIIPAALMECLDTSCFDRARAHYLPSCPPEQQAHSFSGFSNGQLLDADYFILLGESILSSTSDVLPAILPEPAPSTYEYVDPASGEVTDLVEWAASNPAFDVVSAIDRQYFQGKPVDDKQHIVCPFEDQHTNTSPDLATFAANASVKHGSWTIHCMHSHCADRDRLEFLLKMLTNGWVTADVLRTAIPNITKKRPPKVYFPVTEVLVAPDWSTLSPDEYRIALHLAILAWMTEDGTIADDEWMLSRRMGISESEWQAYRDVLVKTGWLVELDGRLTNTLVKREYDNAQTAYMNVITKAANGGRKTQLNNRLKHQLEAAA